MSDASKYMRDAESFLTVCTSAWGEDGHPLQFDTAAMAGLYDIKAKKGSIKCYLKVGRTHRNFMGNLHGGCTASIVDLVGSAALTTLGPEVHVSISITTNYLRAAPVGSVIRVEAFVLKPGKSINTIEVNIYDEASGKLVAQGTHVKVIVPGVLPTQIADINGSGSLSSKI